MVTVGQDVKRGGRTYRVVDVDENVIKLQVLKDGRLSKGRPAKKTLAEFKHWLNPKSVSQFGDEVFRVKGRDFHLIRYDSLDERFILRGLDDEGNYTRGRPRTMYIEDFSEDDQQRLNALLANK